MPGVPNYSFFKLEERAAAALAANAAYVQDLDNRYEKLKASRRKLGIPAIAIVGMGRAGKDTAGEYLSEQFALAKAKSSSLNALPLVAHMIGIDPKVAYAERHKHREFWIEACNQLRAEDLTRLARWCLGACDIAIGLRGKFEFAAVMNEGVCDLSVWIANDRVPADITVEFTREDCDIVVDNNTSLTQFHAKLHRLGQCLYRAV